MRPPQFSIPPPPGGNHTERWLSQNGHYLVSLSAVYIIAELSLLSRPHSSPICLSLHNIYYLLTSLPPSLKDGYTSFHHAAATNNTDILNQLLISPLSARDINLQTPLKETPLHLACLEGHLQAAQLLSDRGADLGALDGKRNSVLHFSAASGSTELVEWIVSRDIGRDLLNFQNKVRLAIWCMVDSVS